MEKQKSIKINMLMSIILMVSNFVFPLITYAYVARVLLPEGTGKVAFVQSVLSYFMYIAALGISGYGARECAKVRDDKEKLSLLVQELLRVNFASTAVAYVALMVALLLVPKFKEYAVLFVVMSSGILFQTLGIEWLYNALEKYTYITIRSISFKIVAVVLTFLLIKGPDDYVMYGAITIFATLASNILNFINSRKYLSYKKFRVYDLKRHFKPIMIFFFSSIIMSIYGQFDSVMLGFMKNDGEVGIYNAALKMKGIVVYVSTAITSVLVPRMSMYFSKGMKEQFNELLVKSFRVTLILLFPLSLFVFFNASDIIEFVCGTEFLSAIPTLRILMICTLILSITNLFGNQILIPKGDEKRYSSSVFIGMFINLGLNLMFIPKLASVGAAIATLVTESFNAFWMGRGCKNEISYIYRNIRKRPYIVSIIFAVLVEVLSIHINISLPLFIRLVINTICMFGSYYLMQFLQKEPIIYSFVSSWLRKLRIRN